MDNTRHEALVELSAAELLAVAGGLNPQPLPPRYVPNINPQPLPPFQDRD
jgi:hypothetical protein